jgi:hypothetical protein
MPEPLHFFSLKFSVNLTLRYLHLRILLHRPVLVKFLDDCGKGGMDAFEEELLRDIGFNSMQTCMESAISIIDIIHELCTHWGSRKVSLAQGGILSITVSGPIDVGFR